MEGVEGQGERKNLLLKMYVSAFIMFAVLWLQALPLFLTDDVRQFFRKKYFIIYILIAAIVILLGVYVLLVCCKIGKLAVWQFIIFILVIEFGAILLGYLCTCVDSKAVWISLGIAIPSCLVVIFLAFVLPIPKTRTTAFIQAFFLVLALFFFVITISTESAIALVVANVIMIAATALFLFVVTNSVSREGSDSPIFNIYQPFSETASGIPTEIWLYGGFGIFCTLFIIYTCVLFVFEYIKAVK